MVISTHSPICPDFWCRPLMRTASMARESRMRCEGFQRSREATVERAHLPQPPESALLRMRPCEKLRCAFARRMEGYLAGRQGQVCFACRHSQYSPYSVCCCNVSTPKHQPAYSGVSHDLPQVSLDCGSIALAEVGKFELWEIQALDLNLPDTTFTAVTES